MSLYSFKNDLETLCEFEKHLHRVFICIIGNFDKFPIIQKALRAGCARRNKEILPLCGIAAARKVYKPFKIEGRGVEVGLPTLF